MDFVQLPLGGAEFSAPQGVFKTLAFRISPKSLRQMRNCRPFVKGAYFWMISPWKSGLGRNLRSGLILATILLHLPFHFVHDFGKKSSDT